MLALYFPGRRRATQAMLAEAGAGWFCDGGFSPTFRDVIEGGPDGGGGMLVYDERCKQPLAEIDPAQTWVPCLAAEGVDEGAYWIGFWTDQRPGPSDLQRQELLESFPVLLADGHEWAIPIAPLLPKRLTLNRVTGEQEEAVMDVHREFDEQTNDLFAYLVSDEFHGELEEHLKVVIPGGLRYAAKALAKNYRVNLDAVDALGLIGEFEAIDIAGIATGLKMAADVSKKNGAASLLAETRSPC